LGTPAYASPEQAAGRIEQVGAPSDVYGLGATLYFLLTGERPPRAPLPDAGGMDGAADLGPEPPRAQAAAIPPALVALCRKAMAPAIPHRYPSAKALAEDLTRWLDGDRVAAHVETWPERLARLFWRHRVWTVAAAATGTAVLGALLVIITLQVRAYRRLD